MISIAPTSPPDHDEIEISLFGPGFGECVVAHLGFGDWIIVDSCHGVDGQTPAGLDYLKRIGVDVARSVKSVVATHWHDDHVRGLSRTVRECASAKFICSGTMFTKEFVAFTELWKRQGLASSPVGELTEAIETVAQSVSSLKRGADDMRFGFASANRCLWRRPAADRIYSAEIHSLSPSDSALKASFDQIAALFPTGATLTKPLPAHPNRFSVVLLLQVGQEKLLLGADMEEKDNPFGGWSVIVGSAERPQGQASFFKVPHHGSITGECGAVWDEMLLKQPLALLAPFRQGGVRLPNQEDARRICARANRSYITAGFDDRSSRGKTGTVNRTIHETVRYIRKSNSSFGHVRARKKLNGAAAEWTVDRFGDAKPLRELYPSKPT